MSELPRLAISGRRQWRYRAVGTPPTNLSYFSGEDDAPHTQAIHLAAHGLQKSYYKGHAEVPVLRGVDLEVRQGEFLSIIGQSGSGKSTLLHLLATLDAPDEGEIFFQGNRIDNLAPAAAMCLRNKYFGMIFQFYHLLPELTTLENVLVAADDCRRILELSAQSQAAHAAATSLLEMVGLGHRLEAQAARAFRRRNAAGGDRPGADCRPHLLLADEPTGNLDRETGEEIMHLRTLNGEQNLTIIMVTHDGAIADQADRIVRLAGAGSPGGSRLASAALVSSRSPALSTLHATAVAIDSPGDCSCPYIHNPFVTSSSEQPAPADARISSLHQRKTLRQRRRQDQRLRSWSALWRWGVRRPAQLRRQGLSARTASRPTVEFGQGDLAGNSHVAGAMGKAINDTLKVNGIDDGYIRLSSRAEPARWGSTPIAPAIRK